MKFVWALGLFILPWTTLAFEGAGAFKNIETQMGFGPRYVTSEGQKKARAWLKKEVGQLAEVAEVHAWKHQDAHGKVYALENLIFRFNPQAKRRAILGSHSDSSNYPDQDETDPYAPFLGANDGASGVAVLVELARDLRRDAKNWDFGVDLIFFDAEEGELDPKPRRWRPIGSIQFAEELGKYYPKAKPELAIVIDMVCDKDLQLKLEQFSIDSASGEVWRLWQIGSKHSPGFIPEMGYRIYDDHWALIQKGIPSMLLIDFDYPPFHTQKDLIDQCSTQTLTAVGQTLLEFLRGKR